MGYRYTMVDYNKIEGAYELYGYENDKCVVQALYETEDEARKGGERFLNPDREMALA